MDLSSLRSDVQNAADIVIKHPEDGTDTEMVFKVISKDSPQYRNTMAKLATQKKSNKQTDADWRDEKAIHLIAACVVGWDGVAMNGSEYEYSKERAIELLSDPGYRWLYEQLAEAVHNRSHFFKGAATSSPDT